MAVNIHNLIAAVSPDIYCDPSKKGDVKKIISEKGLKGLKEAAEIAKPVVSNFMDFDSISYKNPFSTPGLKNPVEKHTLSYDSFGENLEPIYFWILDTLNTEYKDMEKVEKIIDNFASSPGSGHFSEMGMKATKMQEEAMKMLGAANQVVKSILNIIYDLKEFKMRLKLYDQVKPTNKDENERKGALVSLKQIWMDTVDMKKGNTAIKMMAQQYQYVTLIDAFMASDSLDAINNLDLNDRVKRILQQRVDEFLIWIKESETELRKRFEIEKIYLKSQVNTVKLYARWAKPYLKAARDLEQRATPTAALVTAFNTVLFELTLLGEAEYDPKDDVAKGDLPEMFENKKTRSYSPIIVVELNFRSVPERAGQQGYGFRGRVELSFTSYALNNEELKILRKIMEEDDVDDVFQLIKGATSESLEQLKLEIDEFLGDEKKSDEKKEEKKVSEDTNPFSALFSAISSFFSAPSKKEEKSSGELTKIKSDSDIEKVIRSQTIIKSRQECRKMYDLYKKAHNMPGF